jgi:gliding motility-associatede transport system auxiliary component
MNRTFRAIIAVLLVGIIMFCAISIGQNIGRSWKADVTQGRIYSLSNGSKRILDKLNQPISIKLYYAKTAALKAPDAIRQFNEYYFFVKALLEEYAAYAGETIDFQVIDPRPFSDEEQEALRYGLKRYQITENENFFFGLVAKTQYGAVKSINIFTPDRQNSVEYDISYLLDTLISRSKRKIGVLSSLPVMGDEMSGYMAQMMQMQGKQPRPPWLIVRQLKQQYEVHEIKKDVDEIKDVDLLMVIHPKELPEKTLFAIDQFVLRGGRTIVCVDPHCFIDQPPPQARMQGQMPSQKSDLNRLLSNWGVEMPQGKFAGDKDLALAIPSQRPTARPQKLIGLLNLVPPECFNSENIVSSSLNNVRLLFSGALEKVEIKEQKNTETTAEEAGDAAEKQRYRIEPLLQTTQKGNTFKVDNPYELMPQMFGSGRLMKHFTEGDKPVMMACMITGRFESCFPEGIEVPEEKDDKEPKIVRKTGLTEAAEGTDCTVAVFADVDFISDSIAYQQTFFGTAVAGDNSTLLLNTIENISGSGDLISIRSRGNFRRPFTRVDEIEKKAEEKTADQEAEIQADIKRTQDELSKIVSEHKSKGEMIIDAAEFNKATSKLQLKLSESNKKLRDVQNQRRQEIEALGIKLRNFNMLLAPAVILIIAVAMSIRRKVLRRRYISHASDA